MKKSYILVIGIIAVVLIGWYLYENPSIADPSNPGGGDNPFVGRWEYGAHWWEFNADLTGDTNMGHGDFTYSYTVDPNILSIPITGTSYTWDYNYEFLSSTQLNFKKTSSSSWTTYTKVS